MSLHSAHHHHHGPSADAVRRLTFVSALALIVVAPAALGLAVLF